MLGSPSVDGKANQALIALVAKHSCRRSAVTIRSGGAGRLKWVQIGPD
jgi:uncharacterized protein YggU (UPF0235/DUF167 family)